MRTNIGNGFSILSSIALFLVSCPDASAQRANLCANANLFDPSPIAEFPLAEPALSLSAKTDGSGYMLGIGSAHQFAGLRWSPSGRSSPGPALISPLPPEQSIHPSTPFLDRYDSHFLFRTMASQEGNPSLAVYDYQSLSSARRVAQFSDGGPSFATAVATSQDSLFVVENNRDHHRPGISLWVYARASHNWIRPGTVEVLPTQRVPSQGLSVTHDGNRLWVFRLHPRAGIDIYDRDNGRYHHRRDLSFAAPRTSVFLSMSASERGEVAAFSAHVDPTSVSSVVEVRALDLRGRYSCTQRLAPASYAQQMALAPDARYLFVADASSLKVFTKRNAP